MSGWEGSTLPERDEPNCCVENIAAALGGVETAIERGLGAVPLLLEEPLQIQPVVDVEGHLAGHPDSLF